ncbi:MAG: hypothetical protein ABSC10_06035 [Candidatus Acidiferrales bacterium]|jgi:hypothetical protein
MQELERTSPAQLAAMCQRVADNPGAYLPEAAAQASKLKLEWNALQTFPNPNYAVQKRIEQQKDRVARRMVDFLAGIL